MKLVVDEKGVDEPGINPVNTHIGLTLCSVSEVHVHTIVAILFVRMHANKGTMHFVLHSCMVTCMIAVPTCMRL